MSSLSGNKTSAERIGGRCVEPQRMLNFPDGGFVIRVGHALGQRLAYAGADEASSDHV